MKKVLFALTAISAMVSAQAMAKTSTATVNITGGITSGSCEVNATATGSDKIDFGTQLVSSLTANVTKTKSGTFTVTCAEPIVAALAVTSTTNNNASVVGRFNTDQEYAKYNVSLRDMTVTPGANGTANPALTKVLFNAQALTADGNVTAGTWTANDVGNVLFPHASIKAVAVPSKDNETQPGSFTNWNGTFDVKATIDEAKAKQAVASTGSSTFTGDVTFTLYYN